MGFEVPDSIDDLDIQHERYIEQATEVVGVLLAQIRIELEKQLSEGIKAIKSPTGEGDDSRGKYEQLQRDYHKLRDQLEAFAREKAKAKAPDKSGQHQVDWNAFEEYKKILVIQSAEEKMDRLKALVLKSEDQWIKSQAVLMIELITLREETTQQKIALDSGNKVIEDIEKKVDKFRSLILRGSKEYESQPDIVWMTSYADLTRQIDKIVWALKLDQRPKAKEGLRQKPRDVSLRRLWDWDWNLDEGEKRNRVAAAVFEFLNDEIFLKPAFGLDDEDRDGALETGLVEFEKRVRDSPEGNEIRATGITVWRNLTYKCAKRIRTTSPSTKLNAFASALEDFLEPLKAPNDERFSELILKLCSDAFSLSQRLREEPGAEFEIEIPAPGSVIPEDEDQEIVFVQPFARERGYSAELVGTVAFTRIGGLVRVFQIDGRRIPLVPAWAVVKSI